MKPKLTTLTVEKTQAAVRAGFVDSRLIGRIDHSGRQPHFSYENGKPIAIGGVQVIWPGVGVAWMNSGKNKGNVFRFFKACQLALSKARTKYDLHRIQCEVKAEDHRAVRFAEMLGFKIECRMINYGPDKADFLLMSCLD